MSNAQIKGTPVVAAGAVTAEGTNTIDETLTLLGPEALTFRPSAAGTQASASMLTLGELEVSGAVNVGVTYGYSQSSGDRINLLSAPAESIAALTATSTATATLATDESGARLYDIAKGSAAPALTLGAPNPEHPKAGQSVTIPISTDSGASVACSVAGTSAPCSTSAITFTAPEAYSATVTVTASKGGAVTTRSESVAIPWLPRFVTMSIGDEREQEEFCPNIGCIFQRASIGWSNEPAGSIECHNIPFSVADGNNGKLSFLYAQDALGGYYVNADLDCFEATNTVEFFALNNDDRSDITVIPTKYGPFLMLVTGTGTEFESSLEKQFLLFTRPEPKGTLNLGSLTCPTEAGATGYVWAIETTSAKTNKRVTTLKVGQTISASELPADATVACDAFGSGIWPISDTVLVSGGVRTSASASVTGGASAASAGARAARAKHRRATARKVTLKLRSSGRERLEIRAYNTKVIGKGASAKTKYGLAYREKISVQRGTTKVHFGRRLKASGFQIIVRRIPRHAHGKRAHYSRALVVT
jgi:hypothetical protein